MTGRPASVLIPIVGLALSVSACSSSSAGGSGGSVGTTPSGGGGGTSSGGTSSGGTSSGGTSSGGTSSGGTSSGGSANGGASAGGAAARCTDSGGAIVTRMCCYATGDFPNLCAVGACGCAPANSHAVQVCTCPANGCFDGTQCR